MMVPQGVMGHNVDVGQELRVEGAEQITCLMCLLPKQVKEQTRSGVRDPLSCATWALGCFSIPVFSPSII